MTKNKIEISCREVTLKDTHRLRPNLCLQIYHGFDVKVSPAVEAKKHLYRQQRQRLGHSALAMEKVQHGP